MGPELYDIHPDGTVLVVGAHRTATEILYRQAEVEQELNGMRSRFRIALDRSLQRAWDDMIWRILMASRIPTDPGCLLAYNVPGDIQ